MIRITTRMARQGNFGSVLRAYLHLDCTCSKGYTPVGTAETEEEAVKVAVGAGVSMIRYCTRSGSRDVTPRRRPAPAE